MFNIYAKLRQREKGSKYRKILSTDSSVYRAATQIITSSSPYTAGAVLETEEWFYVSEVSKQQYALDILSQDYACVDFDSLETADFTKIDFVFTEINGDLFIQNISKSKLVSQKHIFSFGEKFEYQNDCNDIVINKFPDAIYQKGTDTLYFRKLESITSIFKGIDQLYREATKEETEQFLSSDFITLSDGYSSHNVKTANRKRIALAQKTLSELSASDKRSIFSYIAEYCPQLQTSDETFQVGSEDELKMLLFGIEQRFYTTPVGGEQRIANSVISLNHGGANNGQA